MLILANETSAASAGLPEFGAGFTWHEQRAA
jgi:hypothetical protein